MATVEINGQVDEELSESLGEMLDREKLWQFCQAFIKEQGITCAEACAQDDEVILNAVEFIAGICEIVGYHKDEDEE